MTPRQDIARVLADMRSAREPLLERMRSLEQGDFALGRRGGWTIGRVAQHLVDADVAYAKLLAFQTGRTPGALREGAPADGNEAAAMLEQTEQAIAALMDGLDADTLYRMVAVGHEEYSPLSLIENIAMHDGEHLAQIDDLLRAARGSQRLASVEGVTIRRGTVADLEAINEIYNHYIRETPITFDIDEWPMAQRRAWFAKFADVGRHQLFVAERGGQVAGFAGSGQFRTKAAYDPTVETTIYCAPDATGAGIGPLLYERLFDALSGEDINLYVAGITLPNDASCRLHERFGFTRWGVVHGVGRKFGRYWDVAWYERPAGK